MAGKKKKKSKKFSFSSSSSQIKQCKDYRKKNIDNLKVESLT